MSEPKRNGKDDAMALRKAPATRSTLDLRLGVKKKFEAFQIGNYENFGSFLDDFVARAAEAPEALNKSQIANLIGLSASAFSKILSVQTIPSIELLYDIRELIGLSDLSFQYLKLLWEHEAVPPRRKEQVETDRKHLQKRLLNTENYVQSKFVDPTMNPSLDMYFLDTMLIIMHHSLSLDRFAQSLKHLRSVLTLSEDAFREKLSYLAQLGLVEVDWKNNSARVLVQSLFLAKESKFLQSHQNILRAASANRISQLDSDSKKTMMMTFATDARGFQKIVHILQSAVAEMHETIVEGNADDIYQLNFDLFSWTRASIAVGEE